VLVIGITGASGAVYGIRMLEVLKEAGVETHLVVSKWAEETIKLETARTISEVRKLATHWYDESDLAAPISSGSLKSLGMVVVPCSVRTLSSIANGFSHNLIARAADVTLKERRRLVLVVRETPLSSIHLENMLRVTRAGAIVMPPNPAFYMKPASLDDLVDCFVGRVLDLFGVEHGLRCRWQAPLTRNEEPVETEDGPE